MTTFDDLLSIMKRLRRECPWDREQTHDSIKGHTIEETYEVVDAIDRKDMADLRAELGDLLLHVVFHSEIAAGNGDFTIDDVLESITSKLIRRHPHIFGDVKVADSDEVKRNWEQIKMEEGRESIIDGIPQTLPALLRAHRMQDKAAKIGFDWPDAAGVLSKLDEEFNEMHEAIASGDRDRMEDEMGDVLFSMVNFARYHRINPEDALRRTIAKFESRFRHIEKRMREEGRDIKGATLEEMDRYWDEAKTL
jgi:MazG family protein